jgi:putative membrane protein insertion efficiency factor
VLPSMNRSCRYTPTCSEYLVDAVEKYGSAKGFYLGVLRIISCHPFSKRPLYDPA